MLDGIDDASIWDFPSGWSDIMEDTSYDGWVSWDAWETPGSWVAPGESLWGVTIRSPWGPGVGRSSWTVYTDVDSYDNIGIIGPQNPGEHVVPEPASIALTLLAVGLAGGAARRRKFRNAGVAEL